MKEMKIGGKTFQYEKVMPESFEKGACAFRVKEENGSENYWVVVPPTLKAQVEGMEINRPDDGHVAALCASENDALMIASSVHIAATVSSISGIVNDGVCRKVDELAEELGFDTDRLKAEVSRLKAEGKSPKEVSEILKPRMEEFKKKPAADTKGGEW